jgi:hypothetical protein
VVGVEHGFRTSRHVREDTFGEATEFIGSAEHPSVSDCSTDQLGVFEGLACVSVNDGVSIVKGDAGGGDLCGEAGGVMGDDDVLLSAVMPGVMGGDGGEVVVVVAAAAAAIRTPFGGATLGPGGAGQTRMDGDAGGEESGAACICFLCFGGAVAALARVDDGCIIGGHRGNAVGDGGRPGDAFCWVTIGADQWCQRRGWCRYGRGQRRRGWGRLRNRRLGHERRRGR